MKKTPEEIIENLGLGRKNKCGNCNATIHEAEILIGDVLERVDKTIPMDEGVLVDYLVKVSREQAKLLYLWRHCGFTKSLQQIAEMKTCERHHLVCVICGDRDTLKPEAQALFNYLSEVL